MNVLAFLNGKKTYITATLALLVVGLWSFQIVDDGMATQALVALGFGGMITLRHAMTTTSAAVVDAAASQPAQPTPGK
jgi:hypothetical protein